MKPKARVLDKVAGKKSTGAPLTLVSHFVTAVRGRGKEYMREQLAAGLAWIFAKIVAIQESKAGEKKARRKP